MVGEGTAVACRTWVPGSDMRSSTPSRDDSPAASYDLATPPRVDREVLGILLIAAVVLTLIQYFGLASRFLELFPYVPGNMLRLNLYALLWWAGCTCTGYFVVPALWLKWRGRALRDYGLRLPRPSRHLWVYPAMFAAMLVPLWWASGTQSFLRTYPFYPYARVAPGLWLLFEASYALQFLTLEFFFRGFLVLGLRRHLGEAAILVSMVPYCMIHFQKPFPETLGAIVAGLVLGFLSLRTGSVLGGVAVHWSVALTMDLLAIWRKGGFVPGVDWFGP